MDLLENSAVDVKVSVRKSNSTHIPIPALPARPPPTAADELEDWNADMAALFEWVGMACLGAQR